MSKVVGDVSQWLQWGWEYDHERTEGNEGDGGSINEAEAAWKELPAVMLGIDGVWPLLSAMLLVQPYREHSMQVSLGSPKC